MGNDSILYHKKMADLRSSTDKGKVQELDRRIAGHLWVMKKSIWTWIRHDVYRKAEKKHILGVDTKISNAILEAGYKIRLMKELYIFHYLRMAEGFDSDEHLKP
jgi:GT2 family glycosyltransferase